MLANIISVNDTNIATIVTVSVVVCCMHVYTLTTKLNEIVYDVEGMSGIVHCGHLIKIIIFILK